MGKNGLKVAARLAAATALTGSLTACDGGFRDLVSSPSTKPQAQAVDLPPAKPGNPVYLEGSRAENYTAYEEAYGAPIEGSGQLVDTGVNVGAAPSVYEDQVIEQLPISEPVSEIVEDYNASLPVQADEIAPAYNPVEVAPYSLPVDQDAYSVMIDEAYNTPNTSFPEIGASIETAEASLPMSTGIFTDASYAPEAEAVIENGIPMVSLIDSAEAEPMMSEPMMVETAYLVSPAESAPVPQSQPYGSTASHRYSALDETRIGTYGAITEEQLLPEITTSAPVPAEPPAVQVAFLADAFVPVPRIRPERSDVYHTAALSPSVPAQPPAPLAQAILHTPLPIARPTARSGQSAVIAATTPIYDPAPSPLPEMIEVESNFFDKEPEIDRGPEVAALTPVAEEPPIEAMREARLESDAMEEPVATKLIPEPEPQPEPKEEVEVAALPTRSDAVDDKEEGVELSGTSWRLRTLDGKTILEATAELHFDGRSGFAGGQAFCNNYGGEFKENLAGTFDMSSIFATEQHCPHTDLEKRYISALKSAKTYRIDPREKKLILLDADGEPMMVFSEF